MRGIRRLIQNQADPEFVLRPDFIAATKLLPKFNFSFDVCIYHHQFGNVIEFIRKCPEVSFILDHIGKPGIKDGIMEPWKRHIRELSQIPNVMCKLSGVTTEADHDSWTREQLRPYIDHVIESFGFNRIMYGGDWPVAELAGKYTDWIGVLDWATTGCTPEEKRKLFRDNGAEMKALLAEIRATDPALHAATDSVAAGTDWMLANATRPDAAQASAVAYLDAAGWLLGGWELARAAKLDARYAPLASFYLRRLLPRAAARLAEIEAADAVLDLLGAA